MQQINRSFDFRKSFYTLGTIGFLLILMIVGRQILIPLTLAALFAALMSPFVNYLVKKKIHESIAIILALLVLLIIGGGIIFILTFEIVNIARNLPDFSEKLTAALTEITAFTQKYIPDAKPIENWQDIVAGQLEGGGKLLLNYATDIGGKVINIILIPIFIILFLIYRKMPARFIEARFTEAGNKESATQVFVKIKAMIAQYLVGTLWFTLVTAVMSFVILISVGSDYVLFFSLLIALMNLIPYVGTIIAFAVVISYQFITMDGLFLPFLTWALLWVSNLIQENALRPWLIGRSTRINALAVLVSVIIGSMIWGVAGMILFIPLVGIAKIAMEEIPELRPYAVFFSDSK